MGEAQVEVQWGDVVYTVGRALRLLVVDFLGQDLIVVARPDGAELVYHRSALIFGYRSLLK